MGIKHLLPVILALQVNADYVEDAFTNVEILNENLEQQEWFEINEMVKIKASWSLSNSTSGDYMRMSFSEQPFLSEPNTNLNLMGGYDCFQRKIGNCKVTFEALECIVENNNFASNIIYGELIFSGRLIFGDNRITKSMSLNKESLRFGNHVQSFYLKRPSSTPAFRTFLEKSRSSKNEMALWLWMFLPKFSENETMFATSTMYTVDGMKPYSSHINLKKFLVWRSRKLPNGSSAPIPPWRLIEGADYRIRHSSLTSFEILILPIMDGRDTADESVFVIAIYNLHSTQDTNLINVARIGSSQDKLRIVRST